MDFEAEIPVARVVITNRDSYRFLLDDFEIKIDNNLLEEGKVNPKCGDRYSVGQTQTKTILCSPPLFSRYLLIQSFVNDTLTICELKVYTG